MSGRAKVSESLVDAAELAVFACLAVLPLEGCDTTGYRVSPGIHNTVSALLSEWAEAAHCIAELHAALIASGAKREQAS